MDAFFKTNSDTVRRKNSSQQNASQRSPSQHAQHQPTALPTAGAWCCCGCCCCRCCCCSCCWITMGMCDDAWSRWCATVQVCFNMVLSLWISLRAALTVVGAAAGSASCRRSRHFCSAACCCFVIRRRRTPPCLQEAGARLQCTGEPGCGCPGSGGMLRRDVSVDAAEPEAEPPAGPDARLVCSDHVLLHPCTRAHYPAHLQGMRSL